MNSLPLLESELTLLRPLPESQPLIPSRLPEAGEQYRFHFDMSKCIGCKCCVVACNEQNGNPASIQWRRVGEVEGGHFPFTQRHYLSLGCNHCVEPSCLTGCPVEAYSKDSSTGVVIHSADTCIGCQYCIWNCSYGVPQYNPERGVVGKCDLCHNRLSDGMAPACASACPEGAIAIEIVNVEEWRASYDANEVPGLPSGDECISTTRITLPAQLPHDLGRVDTQMLHPEPPHWPLVFMLVLTQLSVGAFSVLWTLDNVRQVTLLALATALLSISASTLHLGRPIHAMRALRNLRRSWLSREVLSLSVFAGIATLYAAAVWFASPHRHLLGMLTMLSGFFGMFCSARIYVVPARPAWNSSFTVVDFFSTAFLLGPLFIEAFSSFGNPAIAIAGASLQLLTHALRFLWLTRSEGFELRATAVLLSGKFQNQFLLRMAIPVVAGIAIPLASHSRPAAILAFVLALAGEILGRWLFFVTVQPRNMAASFTGTRSAA